MTFAKLNRTIHKWGSIIIALPIILVLITGILLLVRKEFAYLQPPTQKGTIAPPKISFEQILMASKNVEQAGVSTWQDIDRLDVRPSKGVIKVRTNSSWEIQLDASTAKVLQVAYRRSDFIESLHDLTFFEKNAHLWLTLPVAVVLVFLWLTGLYLFFIPYIKRRKQRNR